MSELLLLVAGFVGGMLNSLAGGGSFIVFPALLAAGVPPVLANASNTYAALPGYVSGTFGYWRFVREERGRLLAYSIIAAVFGYLGAELLLHVSDEAFEGVVPVLIGFAVLLFAFGERINRWFAQRRGEGAANRIFLPALLAAVSFYGGFFNAGLGILLLAFFALAGLTNIHTMNGLKLWVSSLIALVAVIRFAIAGAIDWYFGSIALAGVVTGGYVAARLAPYVPQRVIRAAVILYGIGLTIYFGLVTYT